MPDNQENEKIRDDYDINDDYDPADQSEGKLKPPPFRPSEYIHPYMYYIKIAGVLTVVCASIALMLAIINAVTSGIIDANTAREKEASILAIFTDADSVILHEKTSDETALSHVSLNVSVKDIYEVKAGDAVIGYCVNVTSVGFGGEIDMIVGLDTDNQVRGVKIISLYETPGLGSKTADDTFLRQFKGISGKIAVGDNIDAVSGATVSSKAVTAGVNAALSLNLYKNLLPEEDLEAWNSIDDPAPDTEPPPENSSDSTNLPDSDPPELESEPPEMHPDVIEPDETKPDIPAITAPPETTPPPETTALPPETTPPPPETTAPPETEPPETEPQETEPPETEPSETEPSETEPSETEPLETEPPVHETTPPETVPPEPDPDFPEDTQPEEIIENEWRQW